MTSNKHIPVLFAPFIKTLKDYASAIPQFHMIDATLGGGGHTSLVLSQFTESKVFGCDYDNDSLVKTKGFLESQFPGNRIDFANVNFKNLPACPWNNRGWDIILADLGYSSNQLEDASYGMSFQIDGPIDMRTERPSHQPSAWDILNQSTEDLLARIFQSYGEMPAAKKVALFIKSAIEQGHITNSTLSLANFMEKKFQYLLPKGSKIHPATLVFQALRIAVNDELRSLNDFILVSSNLLAPGGLVVIITFHSLEDRIVKLGFKNCPQMTPITKKALQPDEEECRTNPRARSAKMRIYRKNF